MTLRDRIRCQTCLHYAVESGDTECVRIILNAAGDVLLDGAGLVEAGNHAGLTAMHYATYLDHQEVMKVLLSFRANVSAQAEYFDLDWPSVNAGDTPMHVAASKGNVEGIRILLKGYVSNLGAGIIRKCELVTAIGEVEQQGVRELHSFQRNNHVSSCATCLSCFWAHVPLRP